MDLEQRALRLHLPRLTLALQTGTRALGIGPCTAQRLPFPYLIVGPQVEWAVTKGMRLNKYWQLLIQVAVSGGPRVGVLGSICGSGQSQTEHRAGRSQGRALLLPRLEGRAGWRRGEGSCVQVAGLLVPTTFLCKRGLGGLWGPASVLLPQAHQLPSLHSPEVVTVQEGPQCLAGR